MGMRQRWGGTSGLPKRPVAHHSIVSWGKDQVRASVVLLAKGAAELVGVAATSIQGISGAGRPDVDHWAASCEEALSLAEEMTRSSCGRKLVPDYVTMGVPPEITCSISIVASSQRRNAGRGVTFDELRGLVRRGYRKAQDRTRTRAGSATQDLIYGSLAEIALDGEIVADPSGLRGERLELRMSFCLAPLEWIRALEIVAERLELELTAIVPEHVGYASALPQPRALLVLLGDHHTCISMVRHGRLQWTTSADMGEREIICGAAAALDMREGQADALMQAYRARQLRPSVELRLARAFWKELRRWMTALAQAIKSAATSGPMPHHVFFLDGTRRIREAIQSLETPFWEQSLPFDRCPEIIPLGVDAVRNVLDSTAQASTLTYLAVRGLAHYVADVFAPGRELDRAMMANVRRRRHRAFTRYR